MAIENRSQALGKIAEFSKAAQYHHHGEFSWERDLHENECLGYVFEYENGLQFRVYGPKDEQYMYVSGDVQIVPYLAQQLPEADIQEYYNSDIAYQKFDQENKQQIGARAFLDCIDSDTMEALEEEITQLADSTDIRYEPQWTENGTLSRMLIHRQIFPYHDGFTIKFYTASVRTVMTITQRLFLHYWGEIDLPNIPEATEQRTVDTDINEGRTTSMYQ